MAIIFGSDIGVQPTTFNSMWSKLKTDVSNTIDNFKTAWNTNKAPPAPKENVYVDNGWENVPGTAFVGSNIESVDDSKPRSIVSQEPILTVYIKKRAFWGLRNENYSNYLDRGEKLFMRSTKLLFEKKCNQIGTYELLTKANRLISENTSLDYDLANKVINYIEEGVEAHVTGLSEDLDESFNEAIRLGADPNEAISTLDSEIKKVSLEYKSLQEWAAPIVEGIKELQKRNDLLFHETKTSWVVSPEDADMFSMGRGAGVIELTLVTNLNTSLSLNPNDNGSIEFTMEDPYNLTKITKDDIESALYAAVDELERIEQAAISNSEQPNISRGPKYYFDRAVEKEQKLKSLRDNALGTNLIGEFTGSTTGPGIIGGPSRPEIIFEVNPSTGAENKVTASVAGIDAQFTKNDMYVVLLQQLRAEQVPTAEEFALINDIFDDLENYVLHSQIINSAYRDTNSDADVRHARENLRKHYLGKNIVQPMDSVHIYIRGNTTNDGGLVGPLNSLLSGSRGGLIKKFENDESASQAILEEEMRLFGIYDLNIPVDLYKSLRTSGMLRNAGMHVFGGLIKSVSEDYSASNGTYTTRVSGESNMRWLDLSRVNRSPDLTQTKGVLEDPLTPFDIEIDSATGLIKGKKFNQENQRRIGALEINFDMSSENKGQKLDGSPNGNIVQDYIAGVNDAETYDKLKHPPGLVYKWKSGIMVSTLNTSLKTPLDGSDNNSEKLNRDVGVSVVENPFAKQDAADIVSMIITGHPHNYETFYENARSVGTLSTKTGSNGSQSYFDSFLDITRTTNSFFGRFEPLKIINNDPEISELYVTGQAYLQKTSKRLDDLRLQLAEYNGRLAELNRTSLAGDNEGEVAKEQNRLKESLTAIIDGVKAQIDKHKEEFKESASKVGSAVNNRLYGNDMAFRFESAEDNKESIVEHRIRNSMLQVRPQYDCKFNTDKNAFIIGDEYDKDLDIQAYAIEALGSQEIDLYSSQYRSPKEICNDVADILDFEFYCDSQGNIQFRPPRYNKMPLSLLLKMLMLKDNEGVQIYPESLLSLIEKRGDKIDRDLEIKELEIKIDAILLGGKEAASKNIAQINNLVVNESEEVVSKINPDSILADVDDDLVTALISARAKLAGKIGGSAPDAKSKEDRERAEKEIRSLNDPSAPNMFVKRQKRVNRINKNVSEYSVLNETKEKLKKRNEKRNSSDFSFLDTGRQEIIEKYSELIEDDFNDLLGPGSSERYIIYDNQILSSNFTESDNEIMVRVDVTGQNDLLGDGPGVIGDIPVLGAGATDFDLWRQYGYRTEGSINKPFLKDADSQCAPYAMMLLSRARKNAVVGSVTLYGNEYYQLGDVVYVNSRDMLYYVNAVRHNFSYEGGTFTTSLDLRYGHPLGEYILTPLDVMGKILIKKKKEENKPVITRKVSKSLGVSIGVVKFPIQPMHSQDDSEADKIRNEKIAMLPGIRDIAYKNVDSLKDALALSNPHIGTKEASSYPKVEVRGFLTSGSDRELVKLRMRAVRDWLQNPHGRYIKNDDAFIKISDPRYINIKLNPGQISKNTNPVDITKSVLLDEEISRLPSDNVFNLRDIDGHIDNVVEIVMIYKKIEDIKDE